ncbi:MAG: hypothetical protein WD512_10215 [Candidatus Paceibacterota bacterium]
MKNKTIPIIFIFLLVFMFSFISSDWKDNLYSCPDYYPFHYNYCYTHDDGSVSYHKWIPTSNSDIKTSERVALINPNLMCIQ